MSTVLRAVSKHARSLSAASRTAAPNAPRATTRAFHSPFAVLSSQQSPLTAPPPSSSVARGIYEKNIEYPAEPFVSGFGTRTYVVSQPDPANTPYEVPSGAYPTSAPYQPYARTEAPTPPNARFASTSTGFAHPLADRVPRRGENA